MEITIEVDDENDVDDQGWVDEQIELVVKKGFKAVGKPSQCVGRAVVEGGLIKLLQDGSGFPNRQEATRLLRRVSRAVDVLSSDPRNS